MAQDSNTAPRTRTDAGEDGADDPKVQKEESLPPGIRQKPWYMLITQKMTSMKALKVSSHQGLEI